MTGKFDISIRNRIYLSFGLMVLLFAVSGIVTTVTLYRNQTESRHLTKVVDPSLANLNELEKMLVESKMYSTNWVFFRSNEEDKKRLVKLHNQDYGKLKDQLVSHSSRWKHTQWKDSLENILSGFEQLQKKQKVIMHSLKSFSDYNDPVVKLESERMLEEEILPGNSNLISRVREITEHGVNAREQEQLRLLESTDTLKSFLIVLALAVIIVASLLSLYLTNAIVEPMNKIRQILNDLGKGIMRKLEAPREENEIGQMIQSVNNLSEKIQSTASFAREVGARNFDMPYTPLSDEDVLGKSLLAMRDDLRNNEASLKNQNRELERQNRELEQFAYVASHDLQEPLRTTSSFVDLLQKQYYSNLDDKARVYLDYIQKSSQQMSTLISDLLEYSRIGSELELQEIDCNEIVSEVLESINTSIVQSQAEIVKANLPVIYGYRTEIKQLFHNLIFNAIKFRKPGSIPCVSISYENAGHEWLFRVRDNGIGISKEHFDRIFIIFQRLHTRSQYPGSGIGLSHCKKIVELHNGKIWLESELNFGTTFYFTIPNKFKNR